MKVGRLLTTFATRWRQDWLRSAFPRKTSKLDAAPARANDSTAELVLGRLTFTKSDAISMDSEDLYISRDRVHVKYCFTNTTDAPIDTLVAFPLPDIPPGTEGDETTSGGIRFQA